MFLPPMEIDLSLSGLDNLVNLINRDNNTTVTADEVTIYPPVDYDDPFDRNMRNTMVRLTGDVTSKFPGTYLFKYWRRSLDAISDIDLDLDLLTKEGIPCDTLPDIKAVLCNKLNLISDDVYFTTDVMPTFAWDLPMPYVLLAARMGSYVYTGSVKVNLIKDTRTDLGDIFNGDGTVIVDPTNGAIIISDPGTAITTESGAQLVTETGSVIVI